MWCHACKYGSICGTGRGSKDVSWITVNQCLNCNKCVAALWLSLCLYHGRKGFHSNIRERTWICTHHRFWPVAAGGRTLPGFGIHGWSSIRERCRVWEKGINYCISTSNNSNCCYLLLTVQHLVAVSFPGHSFYKRQQEKACMTRVFILEWRIARFPVYEQISLIIKIPACKMLRDSYLIVWHIFSHETIQQACICEWDPMIQHPQACWLLQQVRSFLLWARHGMAFFSALAWEHKWSQV